MSEIGKTGALDEHQATRFVEFTKHLEEEIGKVIVGQHQTVREVLIALLAGGHVLLEGVPGLGKTLLVRTLGEALQLSFSRIQFTSDLMPADIVGTNIVTENERGRREFRFQPGPVFANLVLADEVNRATPKTQSALLEAMQERTVTVGDATRELSPPFFVIATQNPLEMEGTYPLPEAQLDRFFFKVQIPFPKRAELRKIARRTIRYKPSHASPVGDGSVVLDMIQLARDVPVASHLLDYALDLVMATHAVEAKSVEMVKQYVRYGASPRGLQSLIIGAQIQSLLENRYNVSIADIRAVAHPSLRHRILLNFEAEAEGVTTDQLIDHLVDVVSPD